MLFADEVPVENFIEFNDPNFTVNKDLEINTDNGSFLFQQGEFISLRNYKDNVLIGDKRTGILLKDVNLIKEILNHVDPITLTLNEDVDDPMDTLGVLVEENCTEQFKLSSINITEALEIIKFVEAKTITPNNNLFN